MVTFILAIPGNELNLEKLSLQNICESRLMSFKNKPFSLNSLY